MKRSAMALALAGLVSGCVVVPRRAVVMAPAPVMVTHVHGPGCGHFWGYYSDRPVYYYGGSYSYYDSGRWVMMRQAPPARYVRSAPPGQYYAPRGHAYGRTRRGPPAYPPGPHPATPVR